MKSPRYRLIGYLAWLAAFGLLSTASGQDKTESSRQYHIDIDYSQVPELKDWVEKQLRPVLEEYGQVAHMGTERKLVGAPRTP